MTSAQQSHLTYLTGGNPPNPGYDLVVAITQDSLNAAMLEYFSSDLQPTKVCYVWEGRGKAAKLVLTDVSKLPNDPFTIDPNADPDVDDALLALEDANFFCGLSITPGLPPTFDPQNPPQVIVLGDDTSKVVYNMYCAQITVCSITYQSRNTVIWTSLTQPDDQAWAFQSTVDLRMGDPQDSTERFNKLPDTVKTQIKNLGADGFSIQQLLFDLDNAALETLPSVVIQAQKGVQIDPTVVSQLDDVFRSTYWTDMSTRGQPVLHITCKDNGSDPSQFRPSDMNMHVQTNKDSPGHDSGITGLSTLNYLCSALGHALQPAADVPWNWVSLAENKQWDGVIALNRNTFAGWLQKQLMPSVRASCYQCTARTPIDHSTGEPEYNVDAQLAPPDADIGVAIPATGPVVLQFTWNQPVHPAFPNHDTAGINGALGEIEVRCAFNCDVSFVGNTIVIDRHMTTWLMCRHLQTTVEGNIVDVQQTDTYALNVDAEGKLSCDVSSTGVVDNSQNLATDWFTNLFTHLNSIASDIKGKLDFTKGTFNTFAPITFLQGAIFPGGKVFSFSHFQFSDFQDLTASISYLDVTS